MSDQSTDPPEDDAPYIPDPETEPGLGILSDAPAAVDGSKASAAPGNAEEKPSAYRVLARKYRPSDFSEMIGQEALVKTLSNAIDSGRLAHAFILTGVRGVGKTTTARIIAKALNYVGPDGKGGPTTGSTKDCPVAQAIAEDRHPDVIEMDAASRTGVGDVREIIDSVRYGPISARYKVFIIDEVHMLSNNAFNALLKTLEEPPEHVKFIFATTEIRKVPVTVLSRCQRFDLRRVDQQVLSDYFSKIVGWENGTAEDEAIAMVARAADGSVRDGLSLLDQALVVGSGRVTAEQVATMLGLADRSAMVALFEALVGGNPAMMLERLEELYRHGADPVVVLQDLLTFTHFLTRLHVVPNLAKDPAVPEIERAAGVTLVAELGLSIIARLWQMLLKGLSEVQSAPSPQAALEMVLIRIMHAAHLPTPGELIAKLEKGELSPGSGSPAPGPGGNGGPRALAGGSVTASGALLSSSPAAPVEATEAALVPNPQSFPELVALFGAEEHAALQTNLRAFVHLVKFEVGRLEIRLGAMAPASLPQDVGRIVSRMTGSRWFVTLSQAVGEPTLMEQDRQEQAAEIEEIRKLPIVRDALSVFPDAQVTVRRLETVMDSPVDPDNPLSAVDDDGYAHDDLIENEEDPFSP